MNKKISVIIPLLNKGPYITRAIESVLNQSIQNFEIIVVDGGSNDNGPKIVGDFNDSRIRFFVQSGKGVSNARNEGVNSANTDFVAFLDADDEWMPNHLETILRLIEMNPMAGMFATAYLIQSADGKIKGAFYNSLPNPPWEGLLPDYFKSGALGDFAVACSTVVIPKKIFLEMGGFPEGYWWGEDVDLFGKIALKYPVAFSWESGAMYHLDDPNRASTKIRPLDYQEPLIKTARTALVQGKVPHELRESLNEYIWKIESRRAIQYLRAGYPDVAQHILKQCTTKWQYNDKLKLLLLTKIPYPLYLFIRDIRRKLIKRVRKNSQSAENVE